MPLFDNLLQRFGYAKAQAPQPGVLLPAMNPGIGIAGPLSFPGYADRTGQLTELQRAKVAMTSAWVFSDVQGIAREFSTATLAMKIRQGEDLTDVENHELEVLWRRPNTFMGRAFVMQTWAANLLLSGEAYLFLSPLGNRLAELWPVPSWMMSPIPDTQSFIKGYAFKADPRADTPPIMIRPEYIVYSRLFNPFDPHRGLSPLAAARLGVETDLAQATWNRNFFGKENAIPQHVVSLPPTVSNSDYQRFKAELFEFFGGGQRRTMVARGGDVKIDSLGLGHTEMDFIASRGFSRDEIDRTFGYPGGYWTASATEANARHAKAVLIENAVWPLLVLLHEDLNAQLVAYWYGDTYIAEFDDIRPRNVELEIKQTRMRQAYWKIDELRAEEGLEPIGDERGDMLVTEVAMRAKAGTLAPDAPEGTVNITGEPRDDGQPASNLQDAATDPSDDAPTTQPTKAVSGKTRPLTREEAQRTVAQNSTVAALLAPYDDAASTELQRWQTKSLKALKNNKPAAVPFESTILPEAQVDGLHSLLRHCADAQSVKALFAGAAFVKAMGTLTSAERELADELASIFTRAGGQTLTSIRKGDVYDLSGLSDDLKASLLPALTTYVLARAQQEASAVGTALDPALQSLTAGEWSAAHISDLVDGLDTTSQKLVEQAVTQYRDTSGMTRQQLEELLQPAFGSDRASTIAVTGMTAAASQGVKQYQDYLKEMGITMERVFHTVGDACEICTIQEGRAESEWGDGAPPLHPRCRCATSLRHVAADGTETETEE